MALSKNEDAFAFQRMMLLLAGMWPKQHSNLLNKLQFCFAFGMVFAFSSSLLLCILTESEFSIIIQSWTMFISIFNCCLKFSVFYFKMPTLMKILKLLRTSHFSYYDDDLDIYVQKAIRFATIMVKMFWGSAFLTILSLTLAPITSSKPRQLPQPFPADLKDKHVLSYILAYMFQSGSLWVAGWVSTGIDNMATSMMGLAAAYFTILKISITRVTDHKTLLSTTGSSKYSMEMYGKFDTIINDRLSVFVEHHLAVISFTELVESIFTYIVLFQFVASAIGICLAGFTFTSAPVGSHEFVFALSLPITLMFQISLYCTFGNEVTVQSTKIGDACYHTEWQGCGPAVRKSLFLIMERSKRPLILTAGKFIDLSLASLVAVLKSAFSYAAVLQQLSHK